MEEYLGRMVKIKHDPGMVDPKKKYLIVGVFKRSDNVTIYSTDIDGHPGSSLDDVTYLKEFDPYEKMESHYWNYHINEVELVDEFKDVFNKLTREGGDDNE